MSSNKHPISFVYFGTPTLAVTILDKLESEGYIPRLIVTTPDKPVGRKLILTPTPVKQWAMDKHVPCITPENLKEKEVESALRQCDPDLFIVAAYGKIIPSHILDIPKKKTINVHPSLLPLLRGPSPIESAITEGLTKTGVTIMELDALMDHGPIITQQELDVTLEEMNPPSGTVLLGMLAKLGGELLVHTIPLWLNGEITSHPQDHDKATYCRKITKEDGLITEATDPITAIRKIRAYTEWPGAFMFIEAKNHRIRIRVTDAHIDGNTLVIDRVTPEGKKNMLYKDFERGIQ